MKLTTEAAAAFDASMSSRDADHWKRRALAAERRAERLAAALARIARQGWTTKGHEGDIARAALSELYD